MQAGFSMLEVGAVRAKNHINILYKNILDASVACLGFWFIGYMFAYGSSAGGFIGIQGDLIFCQSIMNGAGTSAVEQMHGLTYNALDDGFTDVEAASSDGWEGWFFQWAFAGAAATIVSGAVAERTKFSAYLIFSFVITTFIYPVVVHWGWGSGFLSAWGALNGPMFSGKATSRGMIDFAGSGIVHMVGGVAGLMGAIVVGPRKGRFTDGQNTPIPPSSPQLMALGTLILWFGWYAFNCGSTLMLSANTANLAAKTAMTTTMAASTGCVTMSIISIVLEKNFDIGLALNGILGGLVSITANCSVVNPWAAFLIGGIGAFVCYGASRLLIMLKIDDPLDAFAVHGACGFWGLLATGLFCTDANAAYAAYPNACADPSKAADGEECTVACSTFEQFGVQFVGAIVIFLWTAVMSGLLFTALKFTIGMRVEEAVEEAGMDVSEHGAPNGNAVFPMDEPVKTVTVESNEAA